MLVLRFLQAAPFSYRPACKASSWIKVSSRSIVGVAMRFILPLRTTWNAIRRADLDGAADPDNF
jgi:hypothetical protein